MDYQIWFTVLILVGAIVLFITEWLRVDVVAFGVVVFLLVGGILDVNEALAGFSNPAVLTVAALFVVGGAAMQTGLAASFGRRILRIGGDQPTRLILVLMMAVALLSSFLSDTGTVALLLPAAVMLANDAKVSPSKLLLPMSYGALLGGALTLIGTPPNLIVSELLAEEGFEAFGFFSYTPIGLILLVSGIAFMLLIGRRWLPDQVNRMEASPVDNPAELLEEYRLPGNLFHLRVRRTSGLIGQPLKDSCFREDYEVHVLEILRRSVPRRVPALGAVINGVEEKTIERISIQPTPDTILELDDILIAQGQAQKMTRASNRWNLGVQAVNRGDDSLLINHEIGIAEALLPPRSTLAGKDILSMRFGSRYRLNVLCLNRPGSGDVGNFLSTPLRFGDILLVQGPWENILALSRNRRDFVILGQPEASMGARRMEKARTALVIMAGMLLLMITNLVSPAAAALLAALMMVVTGCLTMDEAYQAIDWKSIILVAGMLPMSTALAKTGAIEIAAEAFTAALGGLGPVAILAALFLVTSLATQVLSNTATTVLVAPIALATSQSLGLQPQAFLMAVAIAASMAFASPVASPANTLVMGAGNYSFRDYLKIGLPMILLMLLITVLVLPLLFPL